MLRGETVAVCCENRTEHTDTVRTSQETCENRTEHTDAPSVAYGGGILCVALTLRELFTRPETTVRLLLQLSAFSFQLSALHTAASVGLI
jgi:hypothetical protein